MRQYAIGNVQLAKKNQDARNKNQINSKKEIQNKNSNKKLKKFRHSYLLLFMPGTTRAPLATKWRGVGGEENQNAMLNSPQIRHSLFLVFCSILLLSCSVQKQIDRSAKTIVLADSALKHAHTGISIFDVSSGKYLYNYQADKYFVPASNTKIATCYVGMKYLGDSLVGIRYAEDAQAIFLIPAGDPSLLHTDFTRQPVIDFLQKSQKSLFITDKNWQCEALGAGWSWSDYNYSYMPERSALPVYGNIIHWVQEKNESIKKDSNEFDQSVSIYSIPEVNWKVRFNPDSTSRSFFVQRERDENVFVITQGLEKKKEQDVPFVTHGIQSALELLKDTVGKEIQILQERQAPNTKRQTIKSQPTDSLLKRMMHRSDNFYAEQTLQMVSNEKLGVMNDEKIIDSLLKTDLNELPQKPHWADGSGLSRYNLFTPQDFVTLLIKMQKEFGMDRLKQIFPTGGRGTLSNYYKQDSGYIYAKTGSLSGVICISGYLYTKKNRFLIFSVLVNNHQGNPTVVRRKVEAFLTSIRNKY